MHFCLFACTGQASQLSIGEAEQQRQSTAESPLQECRLACLALQSHLQRDREMNQVAEWLGLSGSLDLTEAEEGSFLDVFDNIPQVRVCPQEHEGTYAAPKGPL